MSIIKRFFNSKWFLWLSEIGFTIVLLLALYGVWTKDIKIDPQYAPTIINGLTTSVAVLIGFAATCLTIMRAHYPQKWAIAVIGAFFLIFPALILFVAYIELIYNSNFMGAFRLILSSFVSAIILVFAIMFSMLREHW